jgi:transposase-like protein
MAHYQPCPKCASEQAEAIGFTWWGGVVGPKMFNHVKCSKCGTNYNGKTGKSNQQAISIYVILWTIFGIVVIALYPARNSERQNNPSTSAISSQDFERVAIGRSSNSR